jgi:uncharacterized membrane protein
MPVRSPSLDALRQHLPQLLRQMWGQLQKLPSRLPGWRPQLRQAQEHLQKLPSRLPGWVPRRTARSAARTAVSWISWRILAGAILAGGIVHILATFIAALSADGQAYRQLADRLPPNTMTVLPPQSPGRQILPFLPPDMLYAMCRYDLTAGSVAVSASVLDAGWALSLHTPDGRNLYVLPGQARRRTDVSFVIAPSSPDAVPLRRDSAADTQIASPTIEGVVILRAPSRGLAWMAETEAALHTARCVPVKQ